MNKYTCLQSRLQTADKKVRMSKMGVPAVATLDSNGYVILTCSERTNFSGLVLYLSPSEFVKSRWNFK